MRKAMTLAMFIVALAVAIASANCGNDNGNGNGCSGEGTQGPAGPQGVAGQNGTNGVNGASGLNGKDGSNGRDGAYTSAKLVLDGAIRLYDGKRVQWQVFDVLALDRRAQHDVVGGATNDMFGVRFVFKLGPDYASTLIDTQAKEIKALEARLSRLEGI